MIRVVALVVLAFTLTGCMKFQSRPQGPFAKPKKDIPPPYGSVPPAPPKPIGGQSPLDLPSAAPTPPPPPDERPLIPPKPSGPAASANPLPAAPVDKAAKNLGDLKALAAATSTAWSSVTAYEIQLTRRELNPKGAINSEVVVFQYRRDPVAVYSHTISGNGKDRQTVYNPSVFGDELHVKLGQGDGAGPFRPGMVAPSISPDSPKVKEKARYSIREAGFGRWIVGLNKSVAALEAGRIPAESLVYNGEVSREEYPYPLVGVTHNLRPGDDPLIPGGGTRFYYFDMKSGSPSYGLPVLIVAFDANNKEVEYYFADKVKNPAFLTDANFDPARLKK